ncbi:MAG: hypothetical protein V3W14_01120 [Candidatus Neomarinimicrobiota bacterium]
MKLSDKYIGWTVTAGLFLVLLLVSCAEFFHREENSALLTVYLSHGFENNAVRLSVDNEVILDSVITTATAIDSPGTIAQKRVSFGTHTIKVELPEQVVRDTFTLTIAAEVGTVWVEYRPEKKSFRWKTDRILVWLL